MKQKSEIIDNLGKTHNFALRCIIAKLMTIELNMLRRERTKLNDKLLLLIHGGRSCSHKASKYHTESLSLYKRIKHLESKIRQLKLGTVVATEW